MIVGSICVFFKSDLDSETFSSITFSSILVMKRHQPKSKWSICFKNRRSSQKDRFHLVSLHHHHIRPICPNYTQPLNSDLTTYQPQVSVNFDLGKGIRVLLGMSREGSAGKRLDHVGYAPPNILHLQVLGGGFKYFVFSPLFGEDSHFD